MKSVDHQHESIMPASVFVGLWSLAHVTGWLILHIIWQIQDFYILPDLLHHLLVALIPAAIIVPAQGWLLRRGLLQPIKHWVIVGIAGWLAGGLAYHLMWQIGWRAYFYSDNHLYINGVMLALLLPPALFQTAWLLRQTHRPVSLLWVLAGLASVPVFASILTQDDWLLYSLAGATQGFITGTVMLWIMLRPTVGKVYRYD